MVVFVNCRLCWDFKRRVGGSMDLGVVLDSGVELEAIGMGGLW